MVVSSGAARAGDLRAPMDVVNLLSVWGLACERGVEAMGAGPRGIVVNEGIKRVGYRGVVEIVKAVPAPPEKEKEKDGADGKKNGQAATGSQSNAAGKNKKGQKRKNVQDSPGGEGNRPGKKWKGGQKPK